MPHTIILVVLLASISIEEFSDQGLIKLSLFNIGVEVIVRMVSIIHLIFKVFIISRVWRVACVACLMLKMDNIPRI